MQKGILNTRNYEFKSAAIFPLWHESPRLRRCQAKVPGIGAIQVLRNAVGGGGGVSFPEKKRYEGVWFNVISVTRGWVGVKFPGKKHLNSPQPTKKINKIRRRSAWGFLKICSFDME